MLKTILTNIPLQICLITIFVLLFKYSKYFDTKLKYIPILFMYIFLTELLGIIIRINPERNPFFTNLYSDYNFLIYNFYDLIFFGYFFYIFWFYSTNKIIKKVIKYGTLIYFIAFLINSFIDNLVTKPQIYSYTTGGVILSIITFLFIKDNLSKKFSRKNVLIWISLGLLIFHLGFIPINILYGYCTKETLTLNRVLPKIHLALSITLYGSFIYGFIQMKAKLKV